MRQGERIEPYAYLRHVFTELPMAQSLAEVEALLPTRFGPAALDRDSLQGSIPAARQPRLLRGAYLAVCSDTQVGRRNRSRHDVAGPEVTDLAFPARTDVASLARAVAASDAGSMCVVFETLPVDLGDRRRTGVRHGLPDFDLIVCDEVKM